MTSVICDGAKVASLREELHLTQDLLAVKSHLNRRTIQRMEAGGTVSMETLNMAAATLGVIAQELLHGPEEPAAEGNGILLKPERSGIRLVEAILTADEFDCGAVFEPRLEQVEVVQPLLKLFEELHPLTTDSYPEYFFVQGSVARKIEAAARVNADLDRMARLKPEALHVLAGQYTKWGKRIVRTFIGPGSVTMPGEHNEVLTVMAIRIAPITTTSIRIPLNGQPVPEAPLPAGFLGELRTRTPLVELVGQQVRLERSGRQWKGCCPFHEETKPSFYIYEDCHYHCFGCGAHGDVIGFVMKSEGVGFREAVKRLADQAGLEVPEPSFEILREGAPNWDAPKSGDLDDEIPF
jgi:transcriptional regulator with XRE-family HTH domain